MTRFPRFVLLGCALLLVGCDHGDTQDTTVPRSVSRVSLTDGRDDAWGVDSGDHARMLPNGDAVGGLVRRTTHALWVTVRYADIRPRANQDWGMQFEMDIPGDDLRRDVGWGQTRYVDTHRWHSEAYYTKTSSEDSLGPLCHGLRGRPDFATNRVTVRVPERCFDKAPWVVVSGLSADSFPWTSRGRYADHVVDVVGTPGPEPERTPRLVRPSRPGR